MKYYMIYYFIYMYTTNVDSKTICTMHVGKDINQYLIGIFIHI